MEYIYETMHYAIEISTGEDDINYAIRNKKYGVVEARCGALFVAYELIKELQTKLHPHLEAAEPAVNNVRNLHVPATTPID